MKKTILQIALLLFGIGLYAQDRTLLEIDNEKIDADEFIHIFNKNANHDGKVTRKDVDEYMELFVNFKLKVHEGQAQGLDTSRSFRQEIAGYRKQLAQPYLSDKSVEDELIREAYDRMCYDVDVSHILITVNSNASPEDTLKAWNKINEVYKRAVKGESFSKLADTYSQDPSVAKNHGDLGYCTVFGLVYDFETVMYNTKPGEVSAPFRTRYGYHILKVNDKRPSKGRYKVAHIMVVSPQDATPEQKQEAKATIENVYAQLKNGADFAEMADKYSADRRTAVKGGELGWINVGGRMIKEFEDAVFKLEKVGDISDIVKTSYGYHIIKLLEKEPIKPFEECKADLKSKVSGNLRSYKGRDVVIANLRKEYGIKDMSKTVAPFYKKKYVTDSIFNGTWKIDSTLKLNKVVFEIKDQKFTEKDFAKYLQKFNTKQPPVDIKMLVLNGYKQFSDKCIIEYEEKHLEEKYPSFKYLMKEYHDGILLFALTNDAVWNKAIADSTGLEAYYETVKDNYKWGYRYDVKTYKCKDAKSATELSKALNANFDDETIVGKLNAKDSTTVVAGESALEEKGHSLFVDNAIRESGITETSGQTKVFNKENTVTAVKVIAPTTKKLSEIRGIVTAAYQDYLEKQWTEGLHKKYNVKIHGEMLDQIVKELSESK